MPHTQILIYNSRIHLRPLEVFVLHFHVMLEIDFFGHLLRTSFPRTLASTAVISTIRFQVCYLIHKKEIKFFFLFWDDGDFLDVL